MSNPPSCVDTYTRGNAARAETTTNSTRTFHRHSVGPSIISGSSEQSNIQDKERNALEITAAAMGNPERDGQVPFHTGKNFSVDYHDRADE